MDLSNSTVKTPEAETETPTPVKLSPFRNGVLKRHAPLQLQHHNHHPIVVTYKECLKNHAASIGGHAVDGCGEFMPSSVSNNTDPTSFKCAACGCHRNFHRRDPDELPAIFPPNAIPALEFQPHHRHHPLPPPRGNNGSSPNNSPSPPPISSSYYPSAPHMLLALSHGLSSAPPDSNTPISINVHNSSTALSNSASRKRYRTKFTQDQKDKMLELADRLGWKMQKRDEDEINEFCSEIGVEKGVFKVWMHNNKNPFTKKDNLTLSNNSNAISTPPETTNHGNGINYSDISSSAAAAHYHHQVNDNVSKQNAHYHHQVNDNVSKQNVNGQEIIQD